MNPCYSNGIEAHLNDIVIANRFKTTYDEYGEAYTYDVGLCFAKIIDFHPNNKKCFEIIWLDDKNNKKTERIKMCKLADYRDIVNLTSILV